MRSALTTQTSFGLLAFRWLAVAAQGLTVWFTWPLWQVRETQPLLPLAPLPQFDVGWLLAGSLAVVLVAPRVGVALHAAVLFVAILLDQTRLQPELISTCFLLLATLPAPGARLLGRTHLVALWFFSGFHKLISPGYYLQFSTQLWPLLLPSYSSESARWVAWFMAMFEILLGLMAVVPRTRRAAAWLAMAWHLGVLAVLVRLQWNEAVWPWNITLALSGFALVLPWRESLAEDFRRAGVLVRLAAILLLVSPLGYYLGIVDAYLSHCLYSGNLPMAHWKGRELVAYTYKDLHVPLPPTYRTYKAYFHAVAKPGDEMTIDDPRWCARAFGYAHEDVRQPAP
ncbi:MAG TPA: MauE/DoxX family redox-associated membrane protein [Pirellulales bacterium]|jgi:uncharacterized membrane protein YphA (DoxX/SURF4 family)|nr:MauE/DoxX family redox-associated membrane protein [Pirellulales bacterium]